MTAFERVLELGLAVPAEGRHSNHRKGYRPVRIVVARGDLLRAVHQTEEVERSPRKNFRQKFSTGARATGPAVERGARARGDRRRRRRGRAAMQVEAAPGPGPAGGREAARLARLVHAGAAVPAGEAGGLARGLAVSGAGAEFRRGGRASPARTARRSSPRTASTGSGD